MARKNNLDTMSTDELLAYVKQREKQSPDANTKKIVSIVNSQSIEEKMNYFHIPIRCPDCEGTSKIKYAKTPKGTIRYKCKDCGKTYTALTKTIFDGTDFTWDEMVLMVQKAINFDDLESTVVEIYPNEPIKKHKSQIWQMRLKILDALTKMPMPKLNGIIEVDEKYFRESQKGSHSLFSFVSKNDLRIPRRHNHASKTGIFGSEFICVLSAVDRNKNYYAKCISLGTPDMDTFKKEFEPYIEGVSYICSDAYDIYEQWCDLRSYRHYIEPTQCRIERQGRGYIEVNNKHPQPLNEAEKANNRKIMEEMFAERKWFHIRNSGKMDLDTMFFLKKQDNLHIETINSFHSEFEENLVKNKRSVATKYLPLYVGAFTYRKNWQTKNGHPPKSRQDAQEILIEILKSNYHSNIEEILNKDLIFSLPRPNPKKIQDAKKKMIGMREIVITGKQDSHDQSAYEGDSAYAPFIFDKRKFFSNLGAIRLNDLAKQNGIFFKGQHKEDKIRKLCALPDADKIIAYEVYLHSYATAEEISASKTKRPKYLYKKRGRPKKQ